MTGEHIVKSFDEELAKLDALLIRMAGMVEEQLTRSLTAIARRDSELAERVLARDADIDALDFEIDALVVRLLALRQPMAVDLRAIIGSLRMSSELERMGDYAANLAKRTLALNQCAYVEPAAVLPVMGKIVSRIVKDVLDSYAERDAEKARNAWALDSEVDEIYSSLFRETLLSMTADPVNITALTHLLFMAKNIERIGDHATNIAETVFFMVTGSTLREDRPKSDTSSYAVLDPVPPQTE